MQCLLEPYCIERYTTHTVLASGPTESWPPLKLGCCPYHSTKRVITASQHSLFSLEWSLIGDGLRSLLLHCSKWIIFIVERRSTIGCRNVGIHTFRGVAHTSNPPPPPTHPRASSHACLAIAKVVQYPAPYPSAVCTQELPFGKFNTWCIISLSSSL